MRFSSAEISFSTPWSIDFSCLADWKLEGFMGMLGGGQGWVAVGVRRGLYLWDGGEGLHYYYVFWVKGLS
jgi:hypothetical protein